MNKGAKIFVAGSRGLVGSAITAELAAQGVTNLLTPKRDELDLLDTKAVDQFFAANKPEYVFLAAAKVGGIVANNNFGGDFIYENLVIQNNILNCARVHAVSKLLFLGSSCIYPKLAPQPIKEEYLLTGLLEETNKPYAVAKIAGITMCQAFNKQYGTNFIAAMPTNLYGPRDNFDLTSSHVLPALIRKFHDAKVSGATTVTCWGTGAPMREFLFVEDLAKACVHLMQTYDGSDIVNVGTGEDVTIKELAELVKKVTGFEGEIVWDTSKPDGTPRKLLDVSKINGLGWKAETPLEDGIRTSYVWFQANAAK